MADVRSVCVRCGGDKELPLGRCPGCGHLPEPGEAALSLLVSTRMLTEAELEAVQVRLRRGEPLRPSAPRLAEAAALLRGEVQPEPRNLGVAEELALVAVSVLVTPAPALAAAWAWRDEPAGRAALRVAAIAGAVGVGLLVLSVWA